jgi:hypothetical protein
MRQVGLIATNIDFLGDPERAGRSSSQIFGAACRCRHNAAAGLQTVSPTLYEAACRRCQLMADIPLHHYLFNPDHRGGHDLLGAFTFTDFR